MLQNISISNKCSFELSIYQIILKKKKIIPWFPQKNIEQHNRLQQFRHQISILEY